MLISSTMCNIIPNNKTNLYNQSQKEQLNL